MNRDKQRTKYFAGQYYKHQKGDQTICFIVGQAESGPFVQVISNNGVWQYDSLQHCQADNRGLRIDAPEIHGQVRYGSLCPLRSDIMGPFRFLPMQCRHSVISMGHSLSGGFRIEGQWLDLNGGRGYLEGDSGRSFPREYLWLHCNDFDENLSIMAAVADIPFCGIHFTGCICAIVYQGMEYRLATYYGVRIVAASPQRLILQQGKYRLEVEIMAAPTQPLRAPRKGNMVETIHESNCTPACFRFFAGAQKLFEKESANCSFECNLHQRIR